jgi:pyruvate/2-oxoglutarate/acetoin dehydrogenase E1 component
MDRADTGKPERVGDNLNRALHSILDRDSRAWFLGEDIQDPYGGAFKISRGLSTRHPESVINTPISEGGVIGVAAGLALCGDRPIVEIMFGDFIALGFDQILNFATKSVSMYGHRLPIHLVIRCPVGGGRGYGPTHSQSLQKHLLGIPHLALFELSPFHDNVPLLDRLVSHGEPCVLFENKTLYGSRMYLRGDVDDLFSFDYLDPAGEFARAFIEDPDEADAVIIAPGGLVGRVLTAARDLLIAREMRCQIIVPSRLHPFDLGPLLPILERAGRICLAEESTAGGTWGGEIAQRIYRQLWGRLKNPITLVHSSDSVIPAAAHLENGVLVQAGAIRQALGEGSSA